MIKTKKGAKLSAKQAAARMLWAATTAWNEGNNVNALPQSLTSMADLEDGYTEREEALIKVQVEKLQARIKKLLKVE